MSEKIVQLNEEVIKGQIKELVRGSVEETLNELLEKEAEQLTQAARYERSEARRGYRSGHYDRSLTTTSGDVQARAGGYDELRQTWNEQNRPTRFEYYLNGEPFYLASGYAAVEREYDETGRIVEERYYDGEGRQKDRNEGYDELHQSWNEQNKPARLEYYLCGEAFSLLEGYAALEREYDENGNVICEQYFGEDSEPIACTKGYEVLLREYN